MSIIWLKIVIFNLFWGSARRGLAEKLDKKTGYDILSTVKFIEYRYVRSILGLSFEFNMERAVRK